MHSSALALAARGAAPAFAAHDASFRRVAGPAASLRLVAACDAHEGPVYDPALHALYFTSRPVERDPRERIDGPLVAIRRLRLRADGLLDGPDALETILPDANAANGMADAGDGTLLVCEQGSRSRDARISRIDPAEPSAGVTVVAGWRGRALNSPNDVAVASDGSIWFTDPSYGNLQGFRPEPESGDYVYVVDPRRGHPAGQSSGRARVVADGFDKPNGLCFSPDEAVLYVTDSGANQRPGTYYPRRPHHVVAFDVSPRRTLGPARLFSVTAPGFPDGIKVDADGRVYVSSPSGVLVHNDDGVLIGEIRVPGAVNFTFGGPEDNVLFITTDVAVWAAELDVTGPAIRRRRLRALRGPRELSGQSHSGPSAGRGSKGAQA